MRPMFDRFVIPALRPARVVDTRLVRTFGMGESRVAELLGELMARDRNPLVGTTASAGVVTIRMRWESTSAHAPREAGSDALDETERLVRAALGPVVFTPPGSDGERELAQVVLDTLRSRAERLAIAESCTGGLLGAMITDVAGSSAAFTGGWITYTNAMKAEHLGVPESLFPETHPGAPGAVSAEVAEAMARGALRAARHDLAGSRAAHHALAITGIAGPDGGSPDKPVGTVWICRASADGTMDSRRFLFGGGRESVRQWAAVTAMAMLHLKVTGNDVTLAGEQERRTR
jgi:nicotinamide-nucleotide amidase